MLQQKPCSRNVEIPGGGVLKDPLGTEIPKGWGDANQKPSVGGVWIFSGTTRYPKGIKQPLLKQQVCTRYMYYVHTCIHNTKYGNNVFLKQIFPFY